MSETRSLRQRVLGNKPRLLLAGLVVYMFFIPFLTTSYYISIFILANVFAIYAVAWDFLSGLTGYLNFGPSFFVGAGAYGLAILFLQYDIALFLAIPAAFLIAIVAGLMVAIPALRLRGFYFVLITLLLPLLAVKFTTIFSGTTGGNLGLRGLPRLSTAEVYYGSLLLLLVVFSVTYWLSENDFGLVLRGIRANELAVESAGISTTRFKIGAFTVSAFFMAAGGMFYGFYLGTVLPSTTFDLHISIEIILSAMLGGLGTIYGPIGGAYFFIFARELLLPLGSLRFVVLFAVSGVILYAMPNGITPFIWKRIAALLGGNDE